MSRTDRMETDLTRVLSEDGIGKIDIHGSLNNVVHRLPEIKRKMGEPPWSVRVVYNDYISAVIIAQKPGQGNRWHYHDDCDEFWVVLEGALKWVIEEYGEIVAGKMDIVCVPRNMKHKMITVGDAPSIRLSISLPDVKHFFVEEGAK